MNGAPTTTRDEADSIGIAVPREWIQLPVERADFDRFCAEMRRTWADEFGWDRTTQRQAELLLVRIRRDIVRAGIRFVAMYVSSPGDERRTGEPLPGGVEQDPLAGEVLMATCTVGTYTKEALGARIGLTLTNLTMAFGRRADAEPVGAERRFKRIVNLEPPMFHDLPIGRSIRLRRLYELLQPGVLPQRFFSESYLTPLGDDGERCTIANFTTINLGLAPVFSELFATIAGTLTSFTPDQETAFDSGWVDTFDD
jgi:hypothetical protein